MGGEGQVCQDFDHFRKNCTRLSPQWNGIKKAVNYVRENWIKNKVRKAAGVSTKQGEIKNIKDQK